MGPASSKKIQQRHKQVMGLCSIFQPPLSTALPPDFNFSGKPLQGLGPFEPDITAPEKNESTPTGVRSSMNFKTASLGQEASKTITLNDTSVGNKQSQGQSETPLQKTEMKSKGETIALSVKLHAGLQYAKNSSEAKDLYKRQPSASCENAENDQKVITMKHSSSKFAIGLTAARATIPVKPPDRSSPKEQKSSKVNTTFIHYQENAPSITISATTVPIKHTKAIKQPEDGSKSSHHIKETKTRVPKYSNKGTKETQPHQLDKPNFQTQQITAGVQLLKVKSRSAEELLKDLKAPSIKVNVSSLDILSKPIRKKRNKKQNKLKKKVECLNTKVEAENSDIIEMVAPAEPTEANLGFSGRHPFTVNQRCPTHTHCSHRGGLSANVKKWVDECPNYLRESPWVTTAKVAAFVALRQAEEQPEEN